jgi:hypothetical protein
MNKPMRCKTISPLGGEWSDRQVWVVERRFAYVSDTSHPWLVNQVFRLSSQAVRWIERENSSQGYEYRLVKYIPSPEQTSE